jgi:hypothetical protein
MRMPAPNPRRGHKCLWALAALIIVLLSLLSGPDARPISYSLGPLHASAQAPTVVRSNYRSPSAFFPATDSSSYTAISSTKSRSPGNTNATPRDTVKVLAPNFPSHPRRAKTVRPRPLWGIALLLSPSSMDLVWHLQFLSS